MAAGKTYEPIATTTLSSTQSSVTFSSISGSYTDLALIIATQVNSASNAFIGLRFNNDTANNYSITRLYGNGSTVTSDRFTSQSSIDSGFMPGADGTGRGLIIANIMNYTNSTTYKTALVRWDSQAAASTKQFTAAEVALWSSTSAITRIDLAPNGTDFNAGTIITLYGIAAA